MIEQSNAAHMAARREALTPPASPGLYSTTTCARVGSATEMVSTTDEESPPRLDLPVPDARVKVKDGANERMTVKLRRRDHMLGAAFFACVMFMVLLTVFWRPAHSREDLHQTTLHRFAMPITSPLYAVSEHEPLLLGGVPGSPLAPGTAHAMLDLKMVLPCTALRTACLSPPTGATSSAGVGSSDAAHLRRRASVSGLYLTTQPPAVITWEFWDGLPNDTASGMWANGTVHLEAYHESEVFKTLVPADYGVGADAIIYLRVGAIDSDHKSHPHDVLVEVAQLSTLGSWRVPLSAITFVFIFGMIISEVINRVYSAMVGAILVRSQLSSAPTLCPSFPSPTLPRSPELPLEPL